MTYPDAQTLIQSFQLTYQIIKLQTGGLSHEDSILQASFRANCLNWVVGHILVGRNTVLDILGVPQLWGEKEVSLYRSESEPITGTGQELRLDRLLDDLEQTQQRISAALEKTSPDELAVLIPFRGSERSLGQAVAGQHWHETYHTGQLEILRQLAGTDDALI
jgi:hypothetical protein